MHKYDLLFQAVVNQIENTVENIQVVKRKKLICENKVIIHAYRNATHLKIRIEDIFRIIGRKVWSVLKTNKSRFNNST